MTKSVRIESDGTPTGTRVFDADTGTRLQGVRKVSWTVGVGEVAIATVEFVCVEITALGEANKKFAVVATRGAVSDGG